MKNLQFKHKNPRKFYRNFFPIIRLSVFPGPNPRYESYHIAYGRQSHWDSRHIKNIQKKTTWKLWNNLIQYIIYLSENGAETQVRSKSISSYPQPQYSLPPRINSSRSPPKQLTQHEIRQTTDKYLNQTEKAEMTAEELAGIKVSVFSIIYKNRSTLQLYFL